MQDRARLETKPKAEIMNMLIDIVKHPLTVEFIFWDLTSNSQHLKYIHGFLKRISSYSEVHCQKRPFKIHCTIASVYTMEIKFEFINLGVVLVGFNFSKSYRYPPGCI